MIADRLPHASVEGYRPIPRVVLGLAQQLTQDGVQDDPGYGHRLQPRLAGAGEPVQMIGGA